MQYWKAISRRKDTTAAKIADIAGETKPTLIKNAEKESLSLFLSCRRLARRPEIGKNNRSSCGGGAEAAKCGECADGVAECRKAGGYVV
ncbi:hypothetical protein V5799_016827 [Amblyomma americanum]|uniref:Uncharacterized protein n=1 Tax=Amblyomma americanum TaxID=6943 RepID=A0AAQ4F407_AMBAM